MNIYKGWVPRLNMAGVRTPTVWLMDPVAISLVMAPSWARTRCLAGKLILLPCRGRGVIQQGPSQWALYMSYDVFYEWYRAEGLVGFSQHFHHSLGPPALTNDWGDPSMRKVLRVLHIFAVYLLKIVESLMSCGWTLWWRSRTPSSTRQILWPEWWRVFSFFLFSDVSGPHPPNCQWKSSPAVSLEMRRVKLLLLLLVAVTVWWVVLPTAAERGGSLLLMRFQWCQVWGGMNFGGGVDGGLIVPGCLGDEGVDREGPGLGVDFPL